MMLKFRTGDGPLSHLSNIPYAKDKSEEIETMVFNIKDPFGNLLIRFDFS